MDSFDGAAGGEAELYDPPPLRAEPTRPALFVGDVLRRDAIAPPANLLEDPRRTLGSDPIPADRYFSQAFADLEAQKLWPKVWQFACWGQDIPNAGDIHVYRILDRSVLIVRQRDGGVKAFVNACLHRGRELCETHSHQAELKCPYHFFTWGLEGNLKWTPSKWDFPQVEEEKFRLPEVRVAEWNGFLFVNFDKDAPDLETFMGARWNDHWQSWDFTKRYKAAHVQKKVRCNWKAGQDAFIEGFHAFASHSQGAALNADDCGQLDIFDDAPNMSRMQIVLGYPSPRLDPPPAPEETFAMFLYGFMPELAGTPEGEIKPGEDSRDAGARIVRQAYAKRWGVDMSGVSTAETLDAISYFMFPNFMPWGGFAYPLVYRFRPGETPDSCIWDVMLFHPFEGDRPPSCETAYLDYDDSLMEQTQLGGLALVLHQDDVQLPAVQRGMKNLADGNLVLTEYQELRIRHFHKLLERQLGLKQSAL
ncbi:MAG: aromatic ring-hydroxylating dioxygenase subunit alpha [Sphingobium sp.]